MELNCIFHETQMLKCYDAPNMSKVIFLFWRVILNHDGGDGGDVVMVDNGEKFMLTPFPFQKL